MSSAAVLLVMGVVFAVSQLLVPPNKPRHQSSGSPAMATLIPPPQPSLPTSAPTAASKALWPVVALNAAFADLQESLPAVVGMALQPVGGRASDPIVLGQWDRGPAWSTIKVPLVLAATRSDQSTGVAENSYAAIVESSNSAAEALWSSLGDPVVAAQKVEAVLGDAGASPVVQTQRVRAGFSAFGQTIWSLADQARFAAVLACDPRDQSVRDLMGNVTPDQRWGLGQLTGSMFKGGWGPDRSGNYLVRQFGIVATERGMLGVAIATEPNSGDFSDGTKQVTQIAAWLFGHLPELPAGRC